MSFIESQTNINQELFFVKVRKDRNCPPFDRLNNLASCEFANFNSINWPSSAFITSQIVRGERIQIQEIPNVALINSQDYVGYFYWHTIPEINEIVLRQIYVIAPQRRKNIGLTSICYWHSTIAATYEKKRVLQPADAIIKLFDKANLSNQYRLE